MADTGFMDVILRCLDETDHNPDFVLLVREEFERIAKEKPDLVKRYWQAFGNRDAGEIERILHICQLLLSGKTDISNLRINAVTGRLHIGNGNRSALVFQSASKPH